MANLWDIGKTIANMGMAFRYSLMDKYSKDSTRMDKRMERAF
jgi:hypothetical protein